MVGKFPSFIGVQGEGSDPVYKTWKEKRSNIKPLQKPSTIASAMKVGNPLDGNLTLEWINRTSGEMISVSDKEIQGAQNLLAEEEGIYVEKSAAATVAALNKLNNKNSNMVLILTGNGLKEGS